MVIDLDQAAAYAQVFDESFRKPFPCVTRWFLTLANQPQFSSVWGPTELTTTALKFSMGIFFCRLKICILDSQCCACMTLLLWNCLSSIVCMGYKALHGLIQGQ